MNKVRKKFIIYAMLAAFVLLTTLLGIINGVNFTMAAEEADRVTQMIENGGGSFPFEEIEQNGQQAHQNNGRLSGPDSPELPFSARYFTVRFPDNGEGAGELVTYNIAAFSMDEAKALAETLKDEKKGKTGWIDSTYRYRVYKKNKAVYVTILDQGREMDPSYRILKISVIGEVIGLLVCLAFLIFVSRKLFGPLEEADRKQRKFIAEAESEFKIPLTVIHANTEIIEKENGPTEATQSIRRQVRKMTEITKKIGTLSVLEENMAKDMDCDLSELARTAAAAYQKRFEKADVELRTDIQDGIVIKGDEEALQKVFEEILANGLKFADRFVSLSLKKENGLIELSARNDTDLPDGNVEQVFDRFTRLSNASGKDGSGLGLSYVRDIVKTRNGRVQARIENGEYELFISM